MYAHYIWQFNYELVNSHFESLNWHFFIQIIRGMWSSRYTERMSSTYLRTTESSNLAKNYKLNKVRCFMHCTVIWAFPQAWDKLNSLFLTRLKPTSTMFQQSRKYNSLANWQGHQIQEKRSVFCVPPTGNFTQYNNRKYQFWKQQYQTSSLLQGKSVR